MSKFFVAPRGNATQSAHSVDFADVGGRPALSSLPQRAWNTSVDDREDRADPVMEAWTWGHFGGSWRGEGRWNWQSGKPSRQPEPESTSEPEPAPKPEPEPAPQSEPTSEPEPERASQPGSGNPPSGATIVSVGSDIQALVNAAGAGATFWLEAGEHRMQSIVPKEGQTFLGEEGAVLNGSRLLSGFTRDGNDWVIGGQTQEGDRNAEGEGLTERASYPDAVFLDDVPLIHVGSRTEVEPGTFFFDYAANRIYLGDDPTGRKVEAAIASVAFEGAEGVENVTLRGLTIEKYASPIQRAAIGGDRLPQNWLIEDNEVRLNFGVGIAVGDGTKVIGNHIHNNGQLGVAGVGKDILIQGNEIAWNGYFSGMDPMWEAGGSKFALTENLMVRDNHAHHNNGNGLWTDIDNINTLYEGNVVEWNTHGGITHEISYDAVIRNNILTGNGADIAAWLWGSAITILNSRNVEIYGNTVDTRGGANGIGLIQQDRGNVEGFGGNAPYGDYVTTGNHVRDNLIIGPGASGAVADHNEVSMLTGSNMFDRNTYRVSDMSEDMFAFGDWYTWSQLQSVAGWETNGTIALV